LRSKVKGQRSKVKVTGNENVKNVFAHMRHIIVKSGSIYVKQRPE